RRLAAIGAEAPLPAGAAALPEPPSERELEVLRLLAAGLSNQQIADSLAISLGTAKTHVHNLYGKLAARNRAEVVSRATALGLL
ncbi:MAG: LuxR C-terminal-related transcriptional regulator, partial [Chloroflexi bacterium]|nr:LuxR C-terminal-related transcriptional regulator [Chloroflexota bacterium]